MNGVGKFIRDWWHVLAGAAFLVLAVGETRWQVRELIRDKEAEIQQWRRINAQGETIVDHAGRLREIEKHITPDAVQAWGRIQGIVAEDHLRLQRHLEGHD